MLVPVIGNPYTLPSPSLTILTHGNPYYWPPQHMVIPIIGHPYTWLPLSLLIPTHGHPHHLTTLNMVILFISHLYTDTLSSQSLAIPAHGPPHHQWCAFKFRGLIQVILTHWTLVVVVSTHRWHFSMLCNWVYQNSRLLTHLLAYCMNLLVDCINLWGQLLKYTQ